MFSPTAGKAGSKASWSLISTPHTTPLDVHSRDAPHARSERRSSYQPIRRSTERDRHGFRETAQTLVETVDRHGLKKYFLRMCRFTQIFCALWCCRPAVFRRVPNEIRDYLKTFPFCRHSTCSRTQIYRQRCFRLVEVDGVSGQNRRWAPFRNGIKFTNIMGDYKGRAQLRQRKRRFAKN